MMLRKGHFFFKHLTLKAVCDYFKTIDMSSVTAFTHQIYRSASMLKYHGDNSPFSFSAVSISLLSYDAFFSFFIRYYCPQGTSFMIPCPIGTYNPSRSGKSESAACLPCDAGKYCNGTALTAPTGRSSMFFIFKTMHFFVIVLTQ